MLKEKILPADTFVVINKSILSDQDRKIISMLYQPIIGSSATINSGSITIARAIPIL